MDFKYVVAIVRPEVVRALEQQLVRLKVGGVSLSKVKGFGEYKNFFTNDWLTEHTKVEVFIEAERLPALLDALLDMTRSDIPGAGIVAVMPVQTFLHLRTGTEALPTCSPRPEDAELSV